MNYEALLAQTLSDSKKVDRTLALLFKEAGAPPPPKPSPAIANMKKAVSAMSESVKKIAEADPGAIVELWARELARSDFEKGANVFHDFNNAASGASRAAWAANQAKPVWEALKQTGPGARAAIGGVAGGVAGHAAASDEQYLDRHGNVRQKSKLPGTLAGAALGAAGGALTHPAGQKWAKGKAQQVHQAASARMKGLHKLRPEPKAKTGSVELLRSEMQKQANLGAIGSMAMGLANKAGPYVGRALGAVAKSAPLRNAAIGAAGGAAVGGVRHMLKPKDQYGRRQGSLAGSMAGGAAVGGVGGFFSKSVAEQALKSQTVQDAMHGRLGVKKPQAPAGAAGMLPAQAGPSNYGPAQPVRVR
jgi:hypothetical protein